MYQKIKNEQKLIQEITKDIMLCNKFLREKYGNA